MDHCWYIVETLVAGSLPQHNVGISAAGGVPVPHCAAWSERGEYASRLVLVDERDQLARTTAGCLHVHGR